MASRKYGQLRVNRCVARLTPIYPSVFLSLSPKTASLCPAPTKNVVEGSEGWFDQPRARPAEAGQPSQKAKESTHMRKQGAGGALAAARAVVRRISYEPIGAGAAFTRTAAVRSEGGSDARSIGQSATTRFVRQSPAACGASAAAVRGFQVAGGLGLGLGAMHGRAGSTAFPPGLGNYARGARGFKTTAPARKEKDLYKLLNVPKDASAGDIKKAYFKLVGAPPRAVAALASRAWVTWIDPGSIRLFSEAACNQ